VLRAGLRVRRLNELDRTSRFEPNRTHGEAYIPSFTKRFALSLGCLCESAWHGLVRPQPRSTRNTSRPGRGDFAGGNRKHEDSDAEDAVLALGDCVRADVWCARTRRYGAPGRPR